MDQKVLEAQQWLNETYRKVIGYSVIPETGKTGQVTVKALIQALQIELQIATPNGTFGPTTSDKCPTLKLNLSANPSNIVKILQHGLYCKGYNPTLVSGVFGPNTEKAIKKVQSDAGLDADGVVTSLIFKTVLNTDPLVLSPNGSNEIRKMQQFLNKNYYQYFGIIPTNGVYERNTNKALIYALQAEEGMDTNTANGNFGPATQRNCPVLEIGSPKARFVRLLQYALLCNNISVSRTDGVYDTDTQECVKSFQTFAALPNVDGIADLTVWMSLLLSKGNTSRKVSGCDCATVINKDNVSVLIKNGYNTVGRYLTGKYKLSLQELVVLAKNNIRVFPIFQRSGEGTSATSVGYFTLARAILDATDAYNAALKLGFKAGSIIYFAVDYDAYDYEVTDTLIPFFRTLSNTFAKINDIGYQIGIYGPRNVCSRISNAGYAVSSFVADMSTGYSGNLGFALPSNWAFDQIVTTTIVDPTSHNSIEIDKDAVRGTYLGEIINSISFNEAFETALKITSSFEGGYYAVNGNFDGAGLSMGMLQFNIGTGSLQPLLAEYVASNPNHALAVIGAEKLNSIKEMLAMESIEAQLQWAIGIQTDNGFILDWKDTLVSITKDSTFIDIEKKYAKSKYGERAYDYFNKFYFKSMRAYALLFDIIVQNGTQALSSNYDSILSTITGMPELEALEYLANFTAAHSSATWADDVRTRKLCIVNGAGTVHGISYDMMSEFGLCDLPIE